MRTFDAASHGCRTPIWVGYWMSTIISAEADGWRWRILASEIPSCIRKFQCSSIVSALVRVPKSRWTRTSWKSKVLSNITPGTFKYLPNQHPDNFSLRLAFVLQPTSCSHGLARTPDQNVFRISHDSVGVCPHSRPSFIVSTSRPLWLYTHRSLCSRDRTCGRDLLMKPW